MQNTTQAQNTKQVAVHTIYYKYRGKVYTSVTKACTLAQAHYAFKEELNSLNTFTLLRIVANT